eukprot:SAG31_NODE_362_length_16904_cov_7.893218_3_plen_233_part_00
MHRRNIDNTHQSRARNHPTQKVDSLQPPPNHQYPLPSAQAPPLCLYKHHRHRALVLAVLASRCRRPRRRLGHIVCQNTNIQLTRSELCITLLDCIINGHSLKHLVYKFLRWHGISLPFDAPGTIELPSPDKQPVLHEKFDRFYYPNSTFILFDVFAQNGKVIGARNHPSYHRKPKFSMSDLCDLLQGIAKAKRLAGTIKTLVVADRLDKHRKHLFRHVAETSLLALAVKQSI